MKITRSPHVQQPASPAKASGVAGAKGKAFASKLAGAERAAAGPEKAAGARKPSAVADIGAELKAGKLTPEAAIDKVVERVLDRQLGKTASPAQRAQLAAALREALAEDPLIAAKVRALSQE